jgi:hypothetical protein
MSAAQLPGEVRPAGAPAPLASRLAEGLARLGKTAFRAGQEEAVCGVMAGRDVFVVLPTGGGKSLCYMLPAVLLPGARARAAQAAAARAGRRKRATAGVEGRCASRVVSCRRLVRGGQPAEGASRQPIGGADARARARGGVDVGHT